MCYLAREKPKHQGWTEADQTSLDTNPKTDNAPVLPAEACLFTCDSRIMYIVHIYALLWVSGVIYLE